MSSTASRISPFTNFAISCAMNSVAKWKIPLLPESRLQPLVIPSGRLAAHSQEPKEKRRRPKPSASTQGGKELYSRLLETLFAFAGAGTFFLKLSPHLFQFLGRRFKLVVEFFFRFHKTGAVLPDSLADGCFVLFRSAF